MDWVTVNLFDPLNFFRDVLLLKVLIPMRSGYQATPWLAVAVLVGSLGWYLGRARIALPVLGFLAFVMLSGFWARSQITAYMVSFAVLVCAGVGLPLGIWASKHEWRAKPGPAPVRHLPDLSLVHLPDPGDHAVQGG